ncbi:MAG: hypothetical protein IIV74_03255, partial [Alphaproteobacteria bacterium]|nr:hypothetical protein [Alphaproteobacteria bacterium]
MKKIAIFSVLMIGIFGDALCATRPTGRAPSRGQSATTAPQTTTSARAAVGARTGTRATANTKVVNRGRAATSQPTPVVAARAGITQKAINTGTKVATATKNITVSEECQQKYDGCMDSFCMLDNENGGRCICSDKNAELDSILAEIEKLDQQSYQMATFGVEKLEMGTDAEDAIAQANAVAQSIINQDTADSKTSRRKLDLSLWDTTTIFEDDEDIFGESAMSPIESNEGDDLHRVASQLCSAQIPECSSDLQMLQLMYAQRIKSDCAAYENSLKQQKNSSAQKLATAEKALREAALEQLRTANKYDLGQCTIEFRKCMQTTAGCGDDFSSCASMIAMDNTNV